MNIMAFGTGMKIKLGQFDAGWAGIYLRPTPLSWRPRTAQPARLRWLSVPPRRIEWEGR